MYVSAIEISLKCAGIIKFLYCFFFFFPLHPILYIISNQNLSAFLALGRKKKDRLGGDKNLNECEMR